VVTAGNYESANDSHSLITEIKQHDCASEELSKYWT